MKDNFIYEYIEFIFLEKCKNIENYLIKLLENGCKCGNKNIKKFTLIYCENEFKYILCECCKRKHYVFNKEMINNDNFNNM